MWETEAPVHGEADLRHRERKVIVERGETEGMSISLSKLDSSLRYATPRTQNFMSTAVSSISGAYLRHLTSHPFGAVNEFHSYRSATIGSTFAARRAGM